MSIIGLILFLIIAGIALWMFPIEATIKRIILGIAVIVSALWLFAAFGWVTAPNIFR